MTLSFFGQALDSEVEAVCKCIEKYQHWFRKVVNIAKSGLIFSKSCSDYIKASLTDKLHMVDLTLFILKTHSSSVTIALKLSSISKKRFTWGWKGGWLNVSPKPAVPCLWRPSFKIFPLMRWRHSLCHKLFVLLLINYRLSFCGTGVMAMKKTWRSLMLGK